MHSWGAGHTRVAAARCYIGYEYRVCGHAGVEAMAGADWLGEWCAGGGGCGCWGRAAQAPPQQVRTQAGRHTPLHALYVHTLQAARHRGCCACPWRRLQRRCLRPPALLSAPALPCGNLPCSLHLTSLPCSPPAQVIQYQGTAEWQQTLLAAYQGYLNYSMQATVGPYAYLPSYFLPHGP